MNPILFYTFLGIFVVTAVLTLLSLPNWIKIPNNYKKVLFTSLIVEVIGCVILLFKQEMQFKYSIEPESNWVAVSSNNGQIINPQLMVGDSVVFLGQPANEVQAEFKNNILDLKSEGGELLVFNSTDSLCWGKLSAESLKQEGFYNGLEAWKKEIPSSDNYKVIKFISNDGNKTWIQKGKFSDDCPLGIEVYSAPELGYRITNVGTGIVEFDSKNEAENVLDLDRRKLHFLEINHVFYLIRITQADLGNTRAEHYIHFMLVKLQPQLSL